MKQGTSQKKVTVKPALNPSQLFLLQMFAENESEEDFEEMKSVLLNYYQKKLNRAADEFWDSQHLDNAQMEKLMYGHMRASAK
jgi:hypothetical protein